MVRKLAEGHTGIKGQSQNLGELTFKLTRKCWASMRRRQDYITWVVGHTDKRENQSQDKLGRELGTEGSLRTLSSKTLPNPQPVFFTIKYFEGIMISINS